MISEEKSKTLFFETSYRQKRTSLEIVLFLENSLREQLFFSGEIKKELTFEAFSMIAFGTFSEPNIKGFQVLQFRPSQLQFLLSYLLDILGGPELL